MDYFDFLGKNRKNNRGDDNIGLSQEKSNDIVDKNLVKAVKGKYETYNPIRFKVVIFCMLAVLGYLLYGAANVTVNDYQKFLEKEGEKIQKRLAKDTYLIALAIDGEAKSSEGLAKEFLRLEGLGKTHLTFLIGGSYGLSPTLLQKCDAKLSFSKLTFPHQLMRVIFLEQLYRTSRINSGQKYHK